VVKEHGVRTKETTGFKVVRAISLDLACTDASGAEKVLGGFANPEDRAAKILQVTLAYAAAALNCALDVGLANNITTKGVDFMADVDNTSAGATTKYTGATETGVHKTLAKAGAANSCITVNQGAQNKTTEVSLMVLLGYEY